MNINSASLARVGAIAIAASLFSSPAAALLCSSADPTAVPGGAIVQTTTGEALDSILNLTATPPFAVGSTAYVIKNSQPFIGARTFVFDPSQPVKGALGSFILPLAQIRGLTQSQYLDYWALPNSPPTPRNNAIALVTIPAGTQFWSGLTGPITSNGNFWGAGGGTQYFVGKQVVTPNRFQLTASNYLFPTPGAPGPVLVYGPRLFGNAKAIGNYLDRQCVVAYNDLDHVLTSLDVINLANPTNAGPLQSAVNQLSPDRYGAVPLIVGHQQSLVLDAFGGRIDGTRWPNRDPGVSKREIAPGFVFWGRALGDFASRNSTSTMPGYRTTTAGGLAGLGYNGGGFVVGVGAGYMESDVTWRDLGGSSGAVKTGLVGAYGGATVGRALIDGAVAGTFSSFDVSRRIVIPNVDLGVAGLSTGIDRTANGSADAAGVATRLDVGTGLNFSRLALKPFVGLSYGWLNRAGFTEVNAGAADLNVRQEDFDGLFSRLGAFASYDLWISGPTSGALQGDLIWTHRLSGSSGAITAGLVGQPGAFSIATASEDQNCLQPGLALIGRSGGWHAFARYDGDFCENFQANTVTGGVAVNF